MGEVDVSVKWPFKWCLVGSSGSGKTMFSLQLIKNARRIIDFAPSKIIIIYKEYQNIYDKFNNYFPTELIHEDEADIDFITKDNKERMLLICDDLYFSKKLDDVAEQFLVKGRHRNTSWLVLTQSIFNRPALKNISRNCNHITLFKTVRLNEPHIFFSQLRPKASKVLQNIFAKATETSYSYIDIDLSQTCPDKYRYKTNLFDKFVQVFLIMSENTFKKMYLVSESDLKKDKYDNFKEDNFNVSVGNKNICDNGVNISVKPIKKKKQTSGKDNKDADENRDNFIQTTTSPKINGKIDESDDKAEEVLTDKEDQLPGQTPIQDETQSENRENNEKQISSLKRNLLSPQNQSDYQLKKAKRFAPYTFLKSNGEKSMLDEEEVNIENADNVPPPSAQNQSIEFNSNDAVSDSEPSKTKNDNSVPMSNQWMDGIKSRINDRKVQFKRKQDSIGYRIAPEDIKNSLIKPNDFTFLSPQESESLIDKWSYPDKIQQKKIKNNLRNDVKRDRNKRFRLY